MLRFLPAITIYSCLGGTVPTPTSSGVCDTWAPSRSPMHRLTLEELDNTVEAVLGDDTRPAHRLVPAEHLGGFSNNVDVRTLDEATVDALGAVAADVADRAVQDTTTLLGCDLSAGSTCVESWLRDFLPRAWRRPVTDLAEVDRLVDFFEAASLEWEPVTALRMTLEVVLQSPDFLYRVERTTLAAAPGEVVALGGYELASRLSYFLWSAPPDEALMAAAASGALATPDGLAVQTRRLLADPRSDAMVQRFFDEWMELEALDGLEKDPAVFPDWHEGIPELFRQETHAFIDEVWNAEDASFEVLMTAPWTMANDELAEFYGYASPGSTDFTRVARDDVFHAGLFTQGAITATRAYINASSPIHRGLFVRGNLMCDAIPAPDQFEIEPLEIDPSLSVRETLALHRADPVCAGCHNLIDPPGLTFEYFDGDGRYRATDGGEPVDATSVLMATDVDGPVDGVPDLAWRLIDSERVQDCFATQWFRYAQGRRESGSDACSIESASLTFRSTHLDMRELVVATTTAPAFRFVVGPAEVP